MKPPTKSSLDFLLDVLVALSLGGIAHELDFYGVFFRLLEQVPLDVQMVVLGQLNNIVSRYTRVKVYCVRRGWTLRTVRLLVNSQSFDAVHGELVRLCGSLASFSISVREVRILLRLMRSTQPDRRPACWTSLLGVLQSAAQSCSPGVPTVYFDSSGVSSGILLPSFPRLPSGSLSINMWVRVESFHHPAVPQGARPYEPVLIALLDEKDSGLIVRFSSNFLVFQAQTAGKRPTRFSVTVPFRPGQWYCVALSHEYHLIGSDQITVYIDGQMRGQNALPYPKNAGPMSRSSLCCLKDDDHHSNLIGQIATVSIIDGELNNPSAKSLYDAGPFPPVSKDGKQLVLGGKLAPLKLFASYSPRVVDGALCLETAFGHRNMHALKLDGTTEVRQLDVSEAVICAGGPQILLPIFAQLDLPIVSDNFSDTVVPSTPADAAAIFGLIEASLRHDLALRVMLSRHGFHVLGHVLRRVSPSVWDQRSFASLEALSHAAMRLEPLHRAFFLNVYLNFHGWIYAPVAVQRHVISAVGNHVAGRPEYFRQMITVQRVVDALRLYYWSEPSPDSLGKAEVINTQTGQVLGERPKGNDLIMLRQMLLHVVRSLGCGSPTLEEVQALLLYVLLAPDSPNESTDVIQLILAFLNDDKSGPIVAQHIIKGIGMGPVVSLASRKAESVCVWSLKLLAKLLQVCGERNIPQGAWLVLVKSFLQGRHLTRDLYFVLLEIALEVVDTASLTNPIQQAQDQLMKNAAAMSAILELLCLDDRPGARQRTLADLLHLLTSGASAKQNRKRFVNEKGWEGRILAVVSACQKHHAPGSNMADESLALDVVSLMLQHCLMEGDWASVSRLHATLDLFGEAGHLQQIQRLRQVLCGRVAEQLAAASSSVAGICRSDANVGSVLTKWLYIALDSFVDVDVPVQWAFAVSVLFETVLTVAGEAATSEVWSGVIRSSLHALKSACWMLDVVNIAEREEKIGEMEAVLIGQMNHVEQYLVDALAKYKLEKTTSWRQEEKLCTQVFVEVSRRLQVLVPHFIIQAQESSKDLVVCTIAGLGDAAKAMKANREPVVAAMVAIASIVMPSCASMDLCFKWLEQNEQKVADARQTLVRDMEQVRKDGDARKQDAIAYAQALGQEEANKVSVAIDQWQGEWEKVKQKELLRRRDLSRATLRKKELLEGEWKRLIEELSSDRGPWAPENEINEAHNQKICNLETELWKRVLRKRNRNFDPHSGCSRDKNSVETDSQSNLVATTVSMPQLAAFIGGGDADSVVEADDGSSNSAAATSVSGVLFDSKLIKNGKTIDGQLELTQTHVIFTSSNRSRSWAVDDVTDVRAMRFLGRRLALQFEFSGGRSRFLALSTEKDMDTVYQALLGLKPPSLVGIHTSGLLRRRTPPSAASRMSLLKATERWVNGELSNFDYLMRLNREAGRTYCDLAQYPVMPWVIADWSSQVLDLTNPNVFRDFAFPAGAQSPVKRKSLTERYQGMMSMDGGDPPFHHGSHYSSPGVVLFWLLRQEPFTSLHLELQGGKFDHPDRLFNSFSESWNGLWTNTSDAKEMVPELFYDPSFLRNDNRFMFGKTQSGAPVDTVKLPPWAGSAEEFIALHRAALESPYVSQNLHLWIDLIFGVSQRGQRAVDACNMYCWFTYADTIDWSKVDQSSQEVLRSQIENFGQVPGRLFTTPHPQRAVIQKIPSFVGSATPQLLHKGKVSMSETPIRQPTSLVHLLQDGVVQFIYAGGRHVACRITLNGGFRFDPDRANDRQELPFRVSQGDGPGGKVLVAETESKWMLLSCGYWDHTWRAYNVGSQALSAGPQFHLDTILCMAVSRSGRYLISGSTDTTILIWDLLGKKDNEPFRGCGHEGPVTCVAVCEEGRVCCSGSQDGTVILRRIRGGTHLRTFNVGTEVVRVALSSEGHLLVVTAKALMLWRFDNPQLEPSFSFPLESKVMDIAVTNKLFYVALAKKIFAISFVTSSVVCAFDVEDEIDCICARLGFIIVAHSQGRVTIFQESMQ